MLDLVYIWAHEPYDAWEEVFVEQVKKYVTAGYSMCWCTQYTNCNIVTMFNISLLHLSKLDYTLGSLEAPENIV